jgi:hypothetical protein
MDVNIRFDKVFNKTDFEASLNNIFDMLGPAKAMFDAGGQGAEVANLLDQAKCVVEFDMSLSAGFKIGEYKDFFENGSSSSSIGTLFLRINDLGAFAEASLDAVSVELFPSINITDGSFIISTGTRLAAPFEMELHMNGTLTNGLSFGSTMTARFDFDPYGQVYASLPFTFSPAGEDPKELRIIFEDSNLFDDTSILVKVDFDACQVVNMLDNLFAKLGGLTLSAESVLGPVAFSQIDFVNNLDEFFPDAGKYISGVLEGVLSIDASV